ncbi:hypothetical protein LZK98_06070 [Sphingomonas cannabina]|uniref:hypothetical protein n=1 Tax=Sphingomonas cannabina TaxID=2899123 RepID=UPI001F32EDE0|nr:hypothetical protein [Sphingomonas cannabina]UIJ46513.1 hypothetical protein LZK98_06070 [Sphingomonas cannabina]
MTNPINSAMMRSIASMGLMNSNEIHEGGQSNWFEAFANAWGKALDTQADVITNQADVVSQGGDKPSDITALTTESMRMSFMANSSHTSLDSVSKALETMARKS